MGKKLFDYVIGNPPYQETQDATSDKPVYNYLLDSAYKVSEKSEFITPARFLFNAGKTPKSWNEERLNDKHFKVLMYKEDASSIFPNTDIKGGIAITYRDCNKEYNPIEIFVADPNLNSILHKVIHAEGFSPMSDEVYAPESYRFINILYDEHPEIRNMTFVFKGKTVPLISNGHDYDLTSNIFEKLDNIVFFQNKPDDGCEYIRIVGRKNNERCKRWIKRNYVASHENLEKYKILFPKSNGSGKFGEPLSGPLIAGPGEGHTQTFISIGRLDTQSEAEAEMKYIKTKFVRAMLGILKVTQDNKKGVWKYVPLQDFTPASDIDWSKSIHDIDLQLYRKYGLDEKEIEFIETHVKEMA